MPPMPGPHRSDAHSPPSAWVARFAALAPAGEVLDLACGGGRHALLFSAAGHPVLAVDRDAGLLAQLQALAAPGLQTMQVDLERSLAEAAGGVEDAGAGANAGPDVYTGASADAAASAVQAARPGSGAGHGFNWPFAPGRFAAIVVTNYLHRPLLPHLVESLVPGGLLIYETFAQGNERFGKPSNPAFLLAPGELLMLAATSAPPLRVIAFEDGYVDHPAPAMVQRLCARRFDPEAGADTLAGIAEKLLRL